MTLTVSIGVTELYYDFSLHTQQTPSRDGDSEDELNFGRHVILPEIILSWIF